MRLSIRIKTVHDGRAGAIVLVAVPSPSLQFTRGDTRVYCAEKSPAKILFFRRWRAFSFFYFRFRKETLSPNYAPRTAGTTTMRGMESAAFTRNPTLQAASTASTFSLASTRLMSTFRSILQQPRLPVVVVLLLYSFNFMCIVVRLY